MIIKAHEIFIWWLGPYKHLKLENLPYKHVCLVEFKKENHLCLPIGAWRDTSSSFIQQKHYISTVNKLCFPAITGYSSSHILGQPHHLWWITQRGYSSKHYSTDFWNTLISLVQPSWLCQYWHLPTSNQSSLMRQPFNQEASNKCK